jgi:tRNA(Glu) U13 pseudouridine synthase TruD
MIERARAFQCELQTNESDSSGPAAKGVGGEQAVVVQFELAAGCYATSFLFEMCAGDAA